jgi:hypothetical protein
MAHLFVVVTGDLKMEFPLLDAFVYYPVINHNHAVGICPFQKSKAYNIVTERDRKQFSCSCRTDLIADDVYLCGDAKAQITSGQGSAKVRRLS